MRQVRTEGASPRLESEAPDRSDGAPWRCFVCDPRWAAEAPIRGSQTRDQRLGGVNDPAHDHAMLDRIAVADPRNGDGANAEHSGARGEGSIAQARTAFGSRVTHRALPGQL